jgi:hypothetical protein
MPFALQELALREHLIAFLFGQALFDSAAAGVDFLTLPRLRAVGVRLAYFLGQLAVALVAYLTGAPVDRAPEVV